MATSSFGKLQSRTLSHQCKLNVFQIAILLNNLNEHRLVSSVVTTLLLVREVRGSNPRLVKSNTASPTAPHCCYVSSELSCSGAKPRR